MKTPTVLFGVNISATKRRIRNILAGRPKEIVFMATTGPSLNGKTTFNEILQAFIKPEGSSDIVIFQDMSKVISEFGTALTGPYVALSEAIQAFIPKTYKGPLLPDRMFIPLFLIWLEQFLVQNPNLEVLMVAGLPRTMGQLELVKLFKINFIVHMSLETGTGLERLQKRIAKRKKEGKPPRLDDTPEVFHRRREIYQRRTLPAVVAWRGTIYLRAEDPPIDRAVQLLRIFKTASVGKSERIRAAMVPHLERGQENVGEPEHEAYEIIRLLDAPKPTDIKVAA